MVLQDVALKKKNRTIRMLLKDAGALKIDTTYSPQRKNIVSYNGLVTRNSKHTWVTFYKLYVTWKKIFRTKKRERA